MPMTESTSGHPAARFAASMAVAVHSAPASDDWTPDSLSREPKGPMRPCVDVAMNVDAIINPDGLVKCIEGNIVQGISRTLLEQVAFDRKTVTSVDWVTYPILDITETPGEIDVVLINHPEIAPSGAGEPSSRPIAAAIANAVFDATGVRIRRVPLSPEQVKAALTQAI